jgi:hypothetical protein
MLTAGIGQAQPPRGAASAAERTQRLEKLEEDLSSADSNVQLGALEQALAEGSLAERQRAYNLAFASSNALLKGIALRYRLCEKKSLTLQYNIPANYGPEGYVRYRGFNFLTGVTTLAFTACDSDRGSFSLKLPIANQIGAQSGGSGTVSGTTLDLEFIYKGASMRWPVSCSGAFAMQQGAELAGRLACTYTDETFGPVAALVRY